MTQMPADRSAVIRDKISENPRHGQASVEMTLGLIGALFLLLGSFKVFLWMNERLVMRQMQYEASRNAAASRGQVEAMSRTYEPTKKLRVLNEPE